jgi:hypothetical protein
LLDTGESPVTLEPPASSIASSWKAVSATQSTTQYILTRASIIIAYKIKASPLGGFAILQFRCAKDLLSFTPSLLILDSSVQYIMLPKRMVRLMCRREPQL